MANSHAPKWSEDSALDAGDYSRDAFYVGGTDGKGHNEQLSGMKILPWQNDLLKRVSNEIPAFKGLISNYVRNAITHALRYDIPRIEDPKTREALMKEFRLHVDMEDQARHLQRYAEMQRYLDSCRVTLEIYAESKNWMMVTREVEKMRKNLDDGLLWSPVADEVEGLVKHYTSVLKEAGEQVAKKKSR